MKNRNNLIKKGSQLQVNQKLHTRRISASSTSN
jgi:hypothetical protein